MEEEDRHRRSNRRAFLVLVIVAILVIVLIAYVACKSEGGHEYGLFSRKKAAPVAPIGRTFTNYGNPMKKQDYTPASAVKVAPKTDRSKIYRTFSK